MIRIAIFILLTISVQMHGQDLALLDTKTFQWDEDTEFDINNGIKAVLWPKARCFCRIGYDSGPELKQFTNTIKDLGSLKTYGGIRPQSSGNEEDCGRLCAIKASEWLDNNLLEV